MSLLNGIAAAGDRLGQGAAPGPLDLPGGIATAVALSAQPKPEETAVSPPDATPVARETPQAKSGPRMPPGANPYGDNPHAAALWLAERSIVGPESGGRADAQNPVSSAGGLFQITNSTWDAALQKLGLPLAATQAERDAQKYRPDLNTRVMRQINTDAADALARAGLPVTASTLMAAHRLGPSGAVNAVRAAFRDPEAPLVGNGLSTDAVKGNGDVAGLTVGQFLMNPYPRKG